jgi:hypothetical protein
MFGPRLRRRMLLSWSLLLHCRSFLLRSGLMLLYRVWLHRLLRCRSLLRWCWPFLLQGRLMLGCRVWLQYRLLRCRSLLRRCWSFLLQGRLVLRYRVLLRERSRLRFCLVLGYRLYLLYRSCGHHGTFLRIWVQLGNRSLLGSRVHLLRWPLRLTLTHRFRGCLHGWPRLRSLLGNPRSRYRPFSLTRP